MKKSILILFLVSCATHQKPIISSGSPDVRKVNNHIRIKGDSNTVNFFYYRIYGATNKEIDSLKKIRQIELKNDSL